MNLLSTIAMLCQITAPTTADPKAIQALQQACQKELVVCVSNFERPFENDTTKLMECIKAR